MLALEILRGEISYEGRGQFIALIAAGDVCGRIGNERVNRERFASLGSRARRERQAERKTLHYAAFF